MIAVCDVESGNISSVVRALQHVGAQVELTADPAKIATADGAVLPGVGALGAVLEKMRARGIDRVLERRLAGGRPVLGICVGMQAMFDSGTEYGHQVGMGQLPGVVDKLQADVVPHVGWAKVEPPKNSVLFDGLADQRFYFVHSYAVQTDPAQVLTEELFEPPLVTFARHGQRFVAAVEHGPLSATQFHPEKSSDAGLQLLANWLDSFDGRKGN